MALIKKKHPTTFLWCASAPEDLDFCNNLQLDFWKGIHWSPALSVTYPGNTFNRPISMLKNETRVIFMIFCSYLNVIKMLLWVEVEQDIQVLIFSCYIFAAWGSWFTDHVYYICFLTTDIHLTLWLLLKWTVTIIILRWTWQVRRRNWDWFCKAVKQ